MVESLLKPTACVVLCALLCPGQTTGPTARPLRGDCNSWYSFAFPAMMGAGRAAWNTCTPSLARPGLTTTAICCSHLSSITAGHNTSNGLLRKAEFVITTRPVVPGHCWTTCRNNFSTYYNCAEANDRLPNLLSGEVQVEAAPLCWLEWRVWLSDWVALRWPRRCQHPARERNPGRPNHPSPGLAAGHAVLTATQPRNAGADSTLCLTTRLLCRPGGGRGVWRGARRPRRRGRAS